MIKKLMMMFVAAFAAMGAWAATENIESYRDSNGVTWRYVRTNQDEAIIQGADYETLTRHLYMPDTIKGCKVTEVGEYAFAYCDGRARVSSATLACSR